MSEHCGHDLVGAEASLIDGESYGAKRVGCAVASEECRKMVNLAGIMGTVYICRVIYGVFIDKNVYLYCDRLGCTVTAYNGTTENHCESCSHSLCNGYEPVSDMDLEATVYSTEDVRVGFVKGDSSIVACNVRCCSEGLRVTVVARVDAFGQTAAVCNGSLSAAVLVVDGVHRVLDAMLSVSAILYATQSENGQPGCSLQIGEAEAPDLEGSFAVEFLVTDTDRDVLVVISGGHVDPTVKETVEQFEVTECSSLGCSGEKGTSSDESKTIEEESVVADCTHSTVRGILHYAGSTVCMSTQIRVKAFATRDHVLEPNHEQDASAIDYISRAATMQLGEMVDMSVVVCKTYETGVKAPVAINASGLIVVCELDGASHAQVGFEARAVLIKVHMVQTAVRVSPVSCSVQSYGATSVEEAVVYHQDSKVTLDVTCEATLCLRQDKQVVVAPCSVILVSPSGCGANVIIVHEGVSKSKETSHSYVEVHFVGETKYGFTVSSELGPFAAVTALVDCAYDKIALNTQEANVCGVARAVAVIDGDELAVLSREYASRTLFAVDESSAFTAVAAYSQTSVCHAVCMCGRDADKLCNSVKLAMAEQVYMA